MTVPPPLYGPTLLHMRPPHRPTHEHQKTSVVRMPPAETSKPPQPQERAPPPASRPPFYLLRQAPSRLASERHSIPSCQAQRTYSKLLRHGLQQQERHLEPRSPLWTMSINSQEKQDLLLTREVVSMKDALQLARIDHAADVIHVHVAAQYGITYTSMQLEAA